MILFYLWCGLAGLLLVLLLLKFCLGIGLVIRGNQMNWSQYNSLLLVLAGLVFLPIMIIFACLKRVR